MTKKTKTARAFAARQGARYADPQERANRHFLKGRRLARIQMLQTLELTDRAKWLRLSLETPENMRELDTLIDVVNPNP